MRSRARYTYLVIWRRKLSVALACFTHLHRTCTHQMCRSVLPNPQRICVGPISSHSGPYIPSFLNSINFPVGARGGKHNSTSCGYCCHKWGSMTFHGLFLQFRQHASTPTWDEMNAQLAQYIPNTYVRIFIVEPWAGGQETDDEQSLTYEVTMQQRVIGH